MSCRLLGREVDARKGGLQGLESEMRSLGAVVRSEESAIRHVVCAVWVSLPL